MRPGIRQVSQEECPTLALSDSLSHLGKGPLTRRTQVMLILGVAVVAIALLVLVSLGGRFFGPPAGAPKKATSPDSFAPTPAQLRTLVVAPVAEISFRTELTTDGK